VMIALLTDILVDWHGQIPENRARLADS